MTIRRLALASLLGQLAWFAFIVFGGLLEPGYSEIRDAVSFLGARDAAHPWIFDTVVAVSGLSVIAVAVAFAIAIFGGLLFATSNSGGHYGLVQRFALVAAVAWILTLALALLDLYGRQRLVGGGP